MYNVKTKNRFQKINCHNEKRCSVSWRLLQNEFLVYLLTLV